MATKINLIRKAIDEMIIANISHQRRAESGDPEYVRGKSPSQQPYLSKITKNCKVVTLGQHVKTNSTVIRVFVQNDGSRSQAESHKSTGKEWILMKISNIKHVSLSSKRHWKPSQLPPNWKGRSDKHIVVTRSVADNDGVKATDILQSNRNKMETALRNKQAKARRKDKTWRKNNLNALIEKAKSERNSKKK